MYVTKELAEFLDAFDKKKFRMTKNAKKAIQIAREIRMAREELAKSSLVRVVCLKRRGLN